MWIIVNEETPMPENPETSVFVEDESGWQGQAFNDGSGWVLETFGQTKAVYFGKIIRYLEIPD